MKKTLVALWIALMCLGVGIGLRTVRREDFLRRTWAKKTVFIELIDGKGEIWLEFHDAIIEHIGDDGITFLSKDKLRWHWQGDALVLDYCGQELSNKVKQK
jgi:hypothetical protein